MSFRSRAVGTLNRVGWKGSADYWERRYSRGGTSGDGSYGEKAAHKATEINRMVRECGARTVIELGCGDGNQLTMADYPSYLGLDVSRTAIEMCLSRFEGDQTKSFLWYSGDHFRVTSDWLAADVVLSLEVIFHLVEDDVFERYMQSLFAMSRGQVIICSSDRDDLPRAPQERHRRFTEWVAANQPGWKQVEYIEPGAGLYSGIYRYQKV
jgi:hypothetical protein